MERNEEIFFSESCQKAQIQDTCRKDESVNVKEQVSIESLDKAKRGLAELVDDELADEVAKSYSKEHAQHIETLKRISGECKTGKYIVLFMGEYRSGKTTTLNAICGGEKIGSIGDGYATAVPVAVSYGRTRSVTVDWKTPEILCNILRHLSCEFEDFDMNEFDIENSKQRKQWLERIENLRKDRKSCPRVGEEELRILVLSAIILRYYASKPLAKKAKQVFSYSDISHLTKFPKDMEIRWYDKGVNTFGIEESLFSFIGRVNCTCPSENLKQLNCIIVVCPGLFSNDYDTKVTEKAMRDAHAIIYFLPYHKGIGQIAGHSLRKIQEEYPDFHRKLFVINNYSLVVGNTTFVEYNREKIKQMFGPEKELYAYDARLAYLAAIRQTYDNNGLTEAEIEEFIKPILRKDMFGNVKKIGFKIFDEKWLYLMEQYMSYVRDRYGKANPTAAELFNYSGLPMVLDELKAFIDNNEACAMAVEKSLKPIRVGIVGVYQSGKSLLINCLLKRSLAVVGDGNATTHTIVKYQYGKKEKVEYRVNEKTHLSSFDKLGQLNKDSSVDEIVISIDCPLLEDFTLIDMPGTGYDDTDNSVASKAIKKIDVAIVIESNFKVIGSEGSSSFKAIHLLNRKKVPYYFVMNCSNMVGDHWNPHADWNGNLAVNNRARLDACPPITSPFEERQVPIVNLMWYWYSIAGENDALLNQAAIKNNLCQYIDEYCDLKNGYLKKDLFQKASNFELISKIFSMDNLAFLELKKELKELREELCPVGTIQAFAFNGIREGWMICDGQSLNKADYPELFDVIGETFGGDGQKTFNIPDLRDRFVRGWSGNGERKFGSFQEDAFQGHGHVASMDRAGRHFHYVGCNKYPTYERDGLFSTTYHHEHVCNYSDSNKSENKNTDHDGEHVHTLSVGVPQTIDVNISVAKETRPKNVALLFCIKVR